MGRLAGDRQMARRLLLDRDTYSQTIPDREIHTRHRGAEEASLRPRMLSRADSHPGVDVPLAPRIRALCTRRSHAVQHVRADISTIFFGN